MLVKISVENFKSFDAPVELTMVSSSKIQDNKEHRIKIRQTYLLKYGVVYGANASGKSNLVTFFSFFKDTVRKGLPLESVDWFCKNKRENQKKESCSGGTRAATLRAPAQQIPVHPTNDYPVILSIEKGRP